MPPNAPGSKSPVHELTIVTRNVRGFANFDLPTLDPVCNKDLSHFRLQSECSSVDNLAQRKA